MGDNKEKYEVGYRKPPKNTQFKKGVSGNPNGRPKKILDFDQELLREAKSLITINEGGRTRRISKHLAVIKQMTNNAIKGTTAGLRMYRDSYRQASERVAQLEAEPAKDRERLKNVRELTEDELNYFLLKALQEEGKLDEDFQPIPDPDDVGQ